LTEWSAREAPILPHRRGL